VEDPSHHQGHAQAKISGHRVIQDTCSRKHCAQEVNKVGEAQSKSNASEEGQFSKERCIDKKEGKFPREGRTRKGGHNDVGNPFDRYSIRNMAT
jgi:hypothetical protein